MRYFQGDVIGSPPPPSVRGTVGLPLFEAADRVHAATEAGILAAHEHADETWKQAAYAALVSVARRKPRFSADDVWDALEGTVTATHNPAALGPLFRVASGRGLIRKRVGDLEPSRLLKADGAARRHREVQFWDSLIVDRKAA